MAFDNERQAIARSAIGALPLTTSVLVVTAAMPLFEAHKIEQLLSLLVSA